MSQAQYSSERQRLSLEGLGAILFDLDGVLTDTASLHEIAWTETFNELFDLVAASTKARTAPTPFTDDDYRRLVDGEPRLDGVRNVLADRKISLPESQSNDEPELSSVQGIASKKDSRFLDLLKQNGPKVFPKCREFMEQLRARGVAVGVVSASKHCRDVLEQAGLLHLADVIVDGNVADEMRLPGKPDPATYLEAAKRLGVEPRHAAVVEDALAGVASGNAGHFRQVIGIDHHNNPEALLSAGATMVADGLASLDLEPLNEKR